MEEQRPEGTATQAGAEAPDQQHGTASDSAEIAKFVHEYINKGVEFDDDGDKEKGDNIWHTLATFVLKELELLKDLDPVVEARCSFRVKSEESLRGKIGRLQKSGQKDGKFQTLDSIRNMRWDIAGTRVCLYFPCQLADVKEFIESNECFEVIPYTPENNKKDTEPLPARLFREREYRMRDPETRPYKERMGYYEADHYWLRLKKSNPKVAAAIPNYVDEPIEIQIRTTLMDSWAEVRHDLDYKHILGYPSAGELRVLDEIKGTIASCEIMQDHLFILREQRIKSDGEKFNFDEPNNVWRAILNTLQPKHRLLLEEFGDTKPDFSRNGRDAIRFLELCNIRSPSELKAMVGLVGTQEQRQAIDRIREAYRIMDYYAQTESKPVMSIKPHNCVTNRRDELTSSEKELTLFSFIAVVLLERMSIKDIQKIFHSPNYLFMPRSGMPVRLWEEATWTDVAGCASRWYQVINTILKTLSRWLDYVDDGDELYTETVSVTWHVHEWVATAYQNIPKLYQIIGIVERLCAHYNHLNSNIWNQRARWLCAAVCLMQWENVEYQEKLPNRDEWYRVRESSGWIFTPEDWESKAWHKGELRAAEIIGIEPIQLKHAIIYRALCQSPKEDGYLLHCFEDKDINVNWQDSCGISLLGAAAAFGSPEICDEMLAYPGANPNLAFPDGLSLIHIAVNHGNEAMMELLVSKQGLNVDAIWRQDPGTPDQRAPYWHQRGFDEFWDWAWDGWSVEEDGDDNIQYAHMEKHSWTALEMAGHLLSTCGGSDKRPKLLSAYRLLQKACKPKE